MTHDLLTIRHTQEVDEYTEPYQAVIYTKTPHSHPRINYTVDVELATSRLLWVGIKTAMAYLDQAWENVREEHEDNPGSVARVIVALTRGTARPGESDFMPNPYAEGDIIVWREYHPREDSLDVAREDVRMVWALCRGGNERTIDMEEATA